jgi:hypothetical protein
MKGEESQVSASFAGIDHDLGDRAAFGAIFGLSDLDHPNPVRHGQPSIQRLE